MFVSPRSTATRSGEGPPYKALTSGGRTQTTFPRGRRAACERAAKTAIRVRRGIAQRFASKVGIVNVRVSREGGLSELLEFSLEGLGDGSKTISLQSAGALRVVPGDVECLKCFGIKRRQVVPLDVLESLDALIVVLREGMPRSFEEEVRKLDEAMERGLAGECGPTSDLQLGLCFLGGTEALSPLVDEGPCLAKALRLRKWSFEGPRHGS